MRRNILIAIALVASQIALAQVTDTYTVTEKEAPAAIKSTDQIQNAKGGDFIEYHNGEKPATKALVQDGTNDGGEFIEYHNGEKPVKKALVQDATNDGGEFIEYHNDEKPLRRAAVNQVNANGEFVEYFNGTKPASEKGLGNAVESGSNYIEYHDGEKPVQDRTLRDDPEEVKGNKIYAKVFPNPCLDNFTVSLGPDTPYANVKVISPYGKVVVDRNMENVETFDLYGLDDGAYVVQISSSREMVMKRLLKR